jgi:MatE
VIGSLFGLLMLPGARILLALGQDPAIAAGGGTVLIMFALGMPAILLFAATTFFLEGIGRSTPGMVVMAIANVVNFGLNYALMFQPWQRPARRSRPQLRAGSCRRRQRSLCPVATAPSRNQQFPAGPTPSSDRCVCGNRGREWARSWERGRWVFRSRSS